jgi:glycosyltransferase involved in cell wall biosynthesis
MAAVQVVMPAYNAEAYIGEAIDSVLAQTFTDWELTVVDDGSTDATADVVAGYSDGRIGLVRTGNGGPSSARNRALAESRSPYVAFLDADDLWRRDKLERQVAVMEAKPDVGLVHTDMETLKDGERSPYPTPTTLYGPESQFVRLAAGNFIASPSVLLRRVLLDRYGGFDEEFWTSEDFELWMRLAPHTTFAYIDEPLLVYRLTRNSLTRRPGPQMGVSYMRMMQKMHRLYPELTAQLGNGYLRYLGRRRCFAGLRGRGRREFLTVLRTDPGDVEVWKWLLFSVLPTRAARALEPVDLSEWVAESPRRIAAQLRPRTVDRVRAPHTRGP